MDGWCLTLNGIDGWCLTSNGVDMWCLTSNGAHTSLRQLNSSLPLQATPTMKTARMPSRISYRYVEIYALRSCDMAYNALLSDDWVCGVAID